MTVCLPTGVPHIKQERVGLKGLAILKLQPRFAFVPIIMKAIGRIRPFKCKHQGSTKLKVKN